MLEYKGYHATVEYDDSIDAFHGQVVDLRDVITFEGQSVDELRGAFQEAVDDYLSYCAERGEQPDKPCSGKVLLRMEPDMHRDLIVHASRAGKSLNAWVADTLRAAMAPAQAKTWLIAQRLAAAERSISKQLWMHGTHRLDQANIVFAPRASPETVRTTETTIRKLVIPTDTWQSDDRVKA